MEQWDRNESTSPASSQMAQQKGEVQFVMRQITDAVRFALCDAIGSRPGLWDYCGSREKCSVSTRKSLFAEVAESINQQFVLDPPLTVEEVEKHWKNLKDTYVKTRKKLTFDHEGCLIRPKWKFFESLTFLDSSSSNQPEFNLKKRLQIPMFPSAQFDLFGAPPVKKEKSDELPTDEYMEFCRSLYLPLKEIGFKDRVQWLKMQKTIRDIVFEAQIQCVTKT